MATCLCVWVTPNLGPPKVMTRRHPSCKEHGDDTEWWARIQARAEALRSRTAGSNFNSPPHRERA